MGALLPIWLMQKQMFLRSPGSVFLWTSRLGSQQWGSLTEGQQRAYRPR